MELIALLFYYISSLLGAESVCDFVVCKRVRGGLFVSFFNGG
jgi:hypothetical protein